MKEDLGVPVCQDITIMDCSMTGEKRRLSWPLFTFTLEEMGEHGVSGAHYRINGATRAEALRWLRSAIQALESERPLEIGGFA